MTLSRSDGRNRSHTSVSHTVRQLRTISKAHVWVALVGGSLFWIGLATNLLSSSASSTFTALYVFNIVIIAIAAGLMFSVAVIRQDILYLCTGLASLFWLLGSAFWIAYVWIAGHVMAYPSVAELSFQSFHILMILAGITIHRRNRTSVPTGLFLGALPLALVPFVVYWVHGIPIQVLLTNTVQLAFIGGVGVLGVTFLFSDEYRVLGAGLLTFTVADVVFHLTTLFDQTPIVMNLDPLWFGAHAVIAYALIHADIPGESI